MSWFLAINRMSSGAHPRLIGAVMPEHHRWIARGIADGWIAQAGKWGPSGGMVLLAADSEEQALTRLAEDPLARSGLVDVELGQLWPDVPVWHPAAAPIKTRA